MCYAGMVVLGSARLQFLDASQTRALLPHMDQLRVCVFIMHLCVGSSLAGDSHIHAGPLECDHYLLLLWSRIQPWCNGSCWGKVSLGGSPEPVVLMCFFC